MSVTIGNSWHHLPKIQIGDRWKTLSQMFSEFQRSPPTMPLQSKAHLYKFQQADRHKGIHLSIKKQQKTKINK